jgi:hypothetical protein
MASVSLIFAIHKRTRLTGRQGKTEAKKQPVSSGCEHGKRYICKLWKNGLIRALNDDVSR